MSTMTSDKKSFFSNLEKLDCSDDESEGEFGRLLASCVKKQDGLGRSSGSFSVSDPSSPLPQSSCVILDSPSDDLVPQQTAVVAQAPVPTTESGLTKTMPRGSKTTGTSPPGKRKRGSSAKILPEQLQIFKSLVFCEQIVH
jgi:DNA polymerase IV